MNQRVPVVYRLDLTDPNSLFVAKSFALRDKDIVYVSNAPSIELVKFLEIVQAITGTTATTAVVVRQAKGL